jgi:hypothetical protein
MKSSMTSAGAPRNRSGVIKKAARLGCVYSMRIISVGWGKE